MQGWMWRLRVAMGAWAVLAVGCGTDERPVAAPAGPGATETARLAAGEGVLTMTSPAAFAKVSEGDTVMVGISVDGVSMGDGFRVRYYLDGAFVAERADAGPYALEGALAGQRHIAARLIAPDGSELRHEGALAARYVRVSKACEISADCSDGLACSNESCVAGQCRYGLAGSGCCDHDLECGASWTCVAGSCLECAGDPDCDDGDACTVDTCTPGGGCDHAAIAECCDAESDCADDDLCTVDSCQAGVCVHDLSDNPLCCNAHAECATDDPCVPYVCYVKTTGATPAGQCRFGPPGQHCCDEDSDCDDGNPCTYDSCDVAGGQDRGSCAYTPPADGSCCLYHGDCDDGEAATVDRCVENTCAYELDPGYCALPDTSEVVISEVQAAPVAAVATKGDWIELYNPSRTHVVDLSGWRLVVDGAAHPLLPAHFVSASPNARKLFPQQRFVIAAGTSQDNGGLLPHYVADGLQLPDPFTAGDIGATRISLERPDGSVVDELRYDATWPWTRGRSFELTNEHLNNGDAAAWAVAGQNDRPALNQRYGNPYLDQWGSPRNPNQSSRRGIPDASCPVPDDLADCKHGACDWRGRCQIEVTSACCEVDADCDDGNPCTADRCEADECGSDPPPAGCCGTNADCDDGNPCNVDRCVDSACVHSGDVVPGCCQSAVDCDDGDLCSDERCVDNQCQSPAVCCESNFSCAGSCRNCVDLPTHMADQIQRLTLATPARLASAQSAWCTWEQCALSPRVSHARWADGTWLIGWMDNSGHGHVSRSDGTTMTSDVVIPKREISDVYAHDDGGFAAMSWGRDSVGVRTVFVSRYDALGVRQWETNINRAGTTADWWSGISRISDARMAFGGGRYVTYHAVKNGSGHHGDQLTYLRADGTLLSDGFGWGCSHSISLDVAYNPAHGRFMNVCASDMFPAKGLMAWRDRYRLIYQGGGAGNGLVSANIGQLQPSPEGWIVAFNAVDRPCCAGHGPAIRRLDIDGYPTGPIVWLNPSSVGAVERDVVLSRVGTDQMPEMYLVGYRDTSNKHHNLGIIDRGGNFLVAWQDVFRTVPAERRAFWPRREDAMSRNPDGSVSWVMAPSGQQKIFLFTFEMP